MIITRVVKWWGSSSSHHLSISVDVKADLHKDIRHGYEIEDMTSAISVVDKFLLDYVHANYGKEGYIDNSTDSSSAEQP